VRAVAQDAEGQMWFGTDAGLARYDGRRVQSVTTEGLAGPRVRALAWTRAARCGSAATAALRARGRLAGVRRVEETRGKSVRAVVAPSAGRALLATSDGLVFDCRLNGDGAVSTHAGRRAPDGRGGQAAAVELTSLALAGETVVVGTRGRGLDDNRARRRGEGGGGTPAHLLRRGAGARRIPGALYFGAQTSGPTAASSSVEGERLAQPSKVAGARRER
jgi:hypothetical protein